MRPFSVGPGLTWKFEARISGPAMASGDMLRSLAARGEAMLRQSPLTGAEQTNWQQREAKFEPLFNDARARWAGVTRQDVVRSIKQSLEGWTIGVFNQENEALPIVLRVKQDEVPGSDTAALRGVQIRPANSAETVPLDQVIDGVAIRWEDPIIWHRDRKRTITLQANPIRGVTLPSYMESLAPQLAELAKGLPPGYRIDWGGEFEASTKSQASLVPGIVPAIGLMLLIVVGLFNSLRAAAIIMLIIPFSVVGMTAGLLATHTPFGFVALLGAMSLAGMMVKNAIVLLDEVNANLAAGRAHYDSVIEAACSRLRPVMLAAATTVLGVAPLLPDVFWVGLAVTIMAGLTIGTGFTMIGVPVLYATFHRISATPSRAAAPERPHGRCGAGGRHDDIGSFSMARGGKSENDKPPITEDAVNAAQQAWCDALVRIGAVHAGGGDFRAAASALDRRALRLRGWHRILQADARLWPECLPQHQAGRVVLLRRRRPRFSGGSRGSR